MKIKKSLVVDASTKMEYTIGKLDVQIDELQDIINSLSYKDASEELVIYIKQCREDLKKQRMCIANLIASIEMILNYYEKCEEDSVVELYGDEVMYGETRSGIIDLTEISVILGGRSGDIRVR